jgi:hypothetical protein
MNDQQKHRRAYQAMSKADLLVNDPDEATHILLIPVGAA